MLSPLPGALSVALPAGLPGALTVALPAALPATLTVALPAGPQQSADLEKTKEKPSRVA